MSLLKTVLVVDDDPGFRALLVQFLRVEGWPVIEAAEGDEGIKLAKAHRPEFILCDLLMPRCNGFQLCRTLRRDESLRHTKIIVTTGRPFETDRQAAFAAGADEYLTKPIEPSALLELLQRLAKAQPAQPELLPANSPGATPSPAWIRFWGVRGSVPTPGAATIGYGGNTSCVELRAEGQIIILDAGTGLRLLGKELVSEFGDEPLDLTLLLSHTHWDHIQGLPFFSPLFQPRNKLRILGYEGARHGLEGALNSQMESPFFPIGLREVPANIQVQELKEMLFTVGNLRVQAAFAHHPGICVGYRVFTPQGSVGFFPDNEPFEGVRRGTPLGSEPPPSELEFARAENQKLIEFLRGTDLLIMDTQYDSEEYRQHVGWGHGCLDDVVLLAVRAGVKRLFLFHHDPDHDDAKIDSMVEHARQVVSDANGSMRVDGAREGEKLAIGNV